MKPEDFDNSASCAMHENCKKCLLKDCCNVLKHYKALKENGCTYACDLICFMQNLDHAAMTVYKYLTAGNKAFIERRVKIYCIYYYKKFGNLWVLFYSIAIFMAKRKPLAKLQGVLVIKKTYFVLKSIDYVLITCLFVFFACGFLFSRKRFSPRILLKQKQVLSAGSKEKPCTHLLCTR